MKTIHKIIDTAINIAMGALVIGAVIVWLTVLGAFE